MVLLASLRTIYLLKFGCIWNTAALPRQLCLPWFLGRPLYWGIIYTGKHNISIYTGKQYFHSEKYQRPCFRATPQSPQTWRRGIPHTLSQLVASRLEVPFLGIVALPYSDPSWSTVHGLLYRIGLPSNTSHESYFVNKGQLGNNAQVFVSLEECVSDEVLCLSNVYACVRPSSMTGNTIRHDVCSLNFCFLCVLGLPSQVSSIRIGFEINSSK